MLCNGPHPSSYGARWVRQAHWEEDIYNLWRHRSHFARLGCISDFSGQTQQHDSADGRKAGEIVTDATFEACFQFYIYNLSNYLDVTLEPPGVEMQLMTFFYFASDLFRARFQPTSSLREVIFDFVTRRNIDCPGRTGEGTRESVRVRCANLTYNGRRTLSFDQDYYRSRIHCLQK